MTRSLSDLGVRREGKRDRDQNLCKFEANSELFNENLRGFWPISAFPQQNHPKSDRLLGPRVLLMDWHRRILHVGFPASGGPRCLYGGYSTLLPKRTHPC
uniref:Uncharacterized protein n=3 Tax=Candidatus Kentrum sp. DK TaxID=2126562 RepID=A0A450TQI5_9GAMM|nr:MAG: hypothetical protein BECKDK2373B_GA0170837_12771 [Candidatus Kentron sp. DK]